MEPRGDHAIVTLAETKSYAGSASSMKLKKAWNKLLVKNANWFGGFGYSIRLGDPDRVLKYARRPQWSVFIHRTP